MASAFLVVRRRAEQATSPVGRDTVKDIHRQAEPWTLALPALNSGTALMEKLVDGQPGPHESWQELADHSIEHDQLAELEAERAG